MNEPFITYFKLLSVFQYRCLSSASTLEIPVCQSEVNTALQSAVNHYHIHTHVHTCTHKDTVDKDHQVMPLFCLRTCEGGLGDRWWVTHG